MIRFKAKAEAAPPARNDKAVEKAPGGSSEVPKPAADSGANARPKAKPAGKTAGSSTAAAKSKPASQTGKDLLDFSSDSTS